MGDNPRPGAYIYVIAAAGRQVTRSRKLFSDGRAPEPKGNGITTAAGHHKVTRRRQELLAWAVVAGRFRRQSLIRSLTTMVWSRSGPTPIAEKRVPDSFSRAST
ncbi:hypothetical protein QFZ23_000818 [Arthrobacter globiformis]|nr:hypothetical protein [Arthrobacter globiformis]